LSSGSHAHAPSVGGFVVTVSARSAAALSATWSSNCRMIGAAMPTSCPSAICACADVTVSGCSVVKLPSTGTVLPSVPSADPLHV
jgi:hypothetical protein